MNIGDKYGKDIECSKGFSDIKGFMDVRNIKNIMDIFDIEDIRNIWDIQELHDIRDIWNTNNINDHVQFVNDNKAFKDIHRLSRISISLSFSLCIYASISTSYLFYN